MTALGEEGKVRKAEEEVVDTAHNHSFQFMDTPLLCRHLEWFRSTLGTNTEELEGCAHNEGEGRSRWRDTFLGTLNP